MKTRLTLLAAALAGCAGLTAQVFQSSSPRDPRWQTVGAGPLASRPAACKMNRDVFICNGAGCGSNGVYHYCSAPNNWSVAGGGGGGGPHTILSSTHTDTTPAAAVRGDVITAQGVTPVWGRLAIGQSGYCLVSNGVDAQWGPCGNAATANALATVPSQCGAGTFSTGIAANGAANCSAIPYAQVSGTPALAPVATSGSATDLSVGTLNPARLPVVAVRTDTSETYTSGVHSFDAATALRLPSTALSPTGGNVRYNAATGRLEWYDGASNATRAAVFSPAGSGIISTNGSVFNARTLTQGSGITVVNGDGVNGNPTISTSSPLPVWNLYTVAISGANWLINGSTTTPRNTVANSAQQLTLGALAAGSTVLAAQVRHTAACTGGTISAVTASLGTAASGSPAWSQYILPFDVFQAPGTWAEAGGIRTVSFSSVNATLNLTPTGDSLANLNAAGCTIEVRMLTMVMP